MNNPDYKYETINTKNIRVDPLYQRPLNDSKIGKITRTFNPYLVNAPKVSFRDGKYWVFDGQHTIAAMKAMRGGADCTIECKVFRGLTWYDEMELFLAQNGTSSPVAVRDHLRAKYNGGDKDVTTMVKLAESVGFTVDFKAGQAEGRIVAVGELFRAYKALSPGDYVNMLSVIKEAWRGSPDSINREILSGMTKFYSTYKNRIDSTSFAKQLSKKTPAEIVRNGKILMSSGSTRYARVLLGIYNNNRSTGRLEDKL